MQANYGNQTQYCTDGCGYKITLPKEEHVSTGKITVATYLNLHRINCSVCNESVKNESCKNDKGENLGCDTGISGICNICGANRTTSHLQIVGGKCGECGMKFYEYSLDKEFISQSQIKVKYKYIPILEGLEFKDANKIEVAGNGTEPSVTDYKFTKNEDGSIELEAILNITQDIPASKMEVRGWFYYTYEGNSETSGGNLQTGYCSIYIYPDNYKPTVKNITVTGADSQTEFSRSATITAKFEETWDSVVEMALFDSDGTVISNWSVASKNGTEFTKEFNVLTETTTSKELTVKAKDRCGNIGEGKITIDLVKFSV